MKLKKLLPLASVAAIAGIVPAVTSCTLHFNPGEPEIEYEEYEWDPANPVEPTLYTEKIEASTGTANDDFVLYASENNACEMFTTDVFHNLYASFFIGSNKIEKLKMSIDVEKIQVDEKSKEVCLDYLMRFDDISNDKYWIINFTKICYVYDYSAGSQQIFNFFKPSLLKTGTQKTKEWSIHAESWVEGTMQLTIDADESESTGVKDFKAMIEKFAKEYLTYDMVSIAPFYLQNIKYK